MLATLTTETLLLLSYGYHKIRKALSRFYHRYSELIVKYNIGFQILMQQGQYFMVI